jgi:quercetin dioxygenase-like cupin family protein
VEPVFTDSETQTAVWFLGALVRIRAGGEHTAGGFALLDHQAERGYGAPLHVHEREDETFFVLEGTVRFVTGDDERTGGPGTLGVLPRGLPHAFVVTSPTARLLTMVTPAGFEGFVTGAGEPAASPTLPPPADGPPDLAALAALGSRYGVEIVGPPPAP